MASSGKKKTTMAKRDRENRLRERRQMKQAKKDARKLAAQDPNTTTDPWANDYIVAPGGPLAPDGANEHVVAPDGPPAPDEANEHVVAPDGPPAPEEATEHVVVPGGTPAPDDVTQPLPDA